MAGEVWLDYVANGEAFAAENFILGSVGLIPHVQLLNPVGSGKRVRLRSVHSTIGAAVIVIIRRHDPALATLGLPVGFITENLLGGGPAPVIEHRSENNVAALGTGFWVASGPANSPAIYPPEGREWGYDLLEGQGIIVQGAVGTVTIAMWQWVEIPL